MKKWETKEGKEIPYKKLEDSHLINILRWINRRAISGMTVTEGGGGPDPDDFWYDEYEIEGKEVLERYDHKGLLKEARKRKLEI